MGRASRRLYRHVGLNLYDQPLSRGRISSAIGALFPSNFALETSAAAETSPRRRLSTARRPALYALRDESEGRERERESERQTEIVPRRIHRTRYTRAEDVTFDVIPGHNPDGAAAVGTCQRVHTRQPFNSKQKLYMTSARLEKARNTCRDTARVESACILLHLVS